MIGMIAIGVAMTITGLGMKYPLVFLRMIPSVKLFSLRLLHDTLSPFFAILLGVMMLTGVVMYLYPWVMRWKTRSSS